MESEEQREKDKNKSKAQRNMWSSQQFFKTKAVPVISVKNFLGIKQGIHCHFISEKTLGQKWRFAQDLCSANIICQHFIVPNPNTTTAQLHSSHTLVK